MVYRLYTEKKPGFDEQSKALLEEIRLFLQIPALQKVRILNRYDVEGIDEGLFARCVPTVFSEPQVDVVHYSLPEDADAVLAVEYLPGQYDQRADSAAQCVQIVSMGVRPEVKTARVYLLYGSLSAEDLAKIEAHLINPVESRKATLERPETLFTPSEEPGPVPVLEGFTQLDKRRLAEFLRTYNLAMDEADLAFLQNYFRAEGRDPTETELRVLDTYWSDHCRHTTFLTELTVEAEDPDVSAAYKRYLALREETGRSEKPVTLMDMATIGAKALQKRGLLPGLDESEEVNACTVKVDVDGRPWLLLFKNETHNHPTEIEPFGGAATCLGGAIRDPLSGRGYVYHAMRVTGAADPTVPVEKTRKGKLPQRKIVTGAAAGFSSYGNQIGLATGLVHELYHPGYEAKRMEIGAVVAAAPAENVVRKQPEPGDVVLLVGGRTGRDGCGGATGSSKSHDSSSLSTCGAEVQKGNPPEERKLQRLFRNPDAARKIKRCNDFGAGGVSVAIGELADGLLIDLDAVPKKYQGLTGTELAISESQERMAVVVSPADVEAFQALAAAENLEATPVAVVTEAPRMVMFWRGQKIVDLDRAFLNSRGAAKTARAEVPPQPMLRGSRKPAGFAETMREMVQDLNVCSQRGLAERFDSTIGAGTVLMPFGGARQKTPEQVMCALLPAEGTSVCSAMAFGGDPYLLAQNPYRGAYLAVLESVLKLAAAGFSRQSMYLSFQEYFEKLGKDPKRWGKPVSALLGALDAQMDLQVAAIGGKDSMSGSFEELDVPPTLISFAVATGDAKRVVSGTLQQAGSKVWLLAPKAEGGFPARESTISCLDTLETLHKGGNIRSASVPGRFGAAERIFKMCLGNSLGFAFADNIAEEALFSLVPGGVLLETDGETEVCGAVCLGTVTKEPVLTFRGEKVPLTELETLFEGRLESVYPTKTGEISNAPPTVTYAGEKAAPYRGVPIVGRKPRALIPVFPGTNCEYDTEKALRAAGFDVETLVLCNQTAADVAASAEALAKGIRQAQLVFLPGGFSGGDEPDGSGKFATAFFRSPAVSEATNELLKQRDGLMAGICNGFQALVKLGLLPFGEILDMKEDFPTLTFNRIGRHQSKLVRTRVCSTKSPWMACFTPGEVTTVPVSHGEGRFVCPEALLQELIKQGQIATQYVDEHGRPTYDIEHNPNGSVWAIEGITSPCGRILGKMGHSERVGEHLYKNVPGKQEHGIFAGAALYFR